MSSTYLSEEGEVAGYTTRGSNEQVQPGTMDSLERLYEESLRSLMSQVRDARSSLHEASQRLPDSGESRERLREMRQTFEELEETLRKSGAQAEGGPLHTGAQVADVLQAGSVPLGETADEEGRLVQRLVDSTGDIMESTLDAAGNVLSEEMVARLRDMTPSNEYTDENGATVQEYTEDVGVTIQRVLDGSGRMHGLQVVTEQDDQHRQA